MRCDFGEPDGSFDGFDLAEERANAGEGVAAPVLEQPRGLGGDLPLVWVREFAPLIDVAPDFVDYGVWVVLLLFGGDAFFVFEQEFALVVFTALAALLGLWHRGEEGGAPAGFGDLVCGLTVGVQLPVAPGVSVGGVQDGLLEKVGRH